MKSTTTFRKNSSITLLVAAALFVNVSFAQNWRVTGNTGIATTDFLGTTDARNLVLKTGNTERMRISAAGNVGIGIAAPSFRLDVAGNSRINGTLKVGAYTLPATDGGIGHVLTTNGAGSVSWQPLPPLAPVAANSYVFSLQSYPGSGLYFDSTSSTSSEYQFVNTPGAFVEKILTISRSTGTTYIRGNLGIGRTAGTRLDIKGANWDLNGTEGDVRIGNNFYRIKMGIATAGVGAGDARIRSVGGTNRLILGSGSNDVLTLSGYKVGIGNVNPNFVLDVNGSAKFTGVIGGTGGLTVSSSGNVGINTDLPSFELDVCGTIRATEVRVETGWCDYVFEKNYELMPIADLDRYIEANKHLPGIASEANVKKEGMKVGEMSSAMMKKIEELTLYVISLQKENEALKQRVEKIESK